MASLLLIPEDVVWTDLGDEVVLLKLESAVYFGLDRAGARIWSLIVEGRSREEIAELMTAEYSLSLSKARNDLEELIAELLKQGLVKDRV